MASHFLFLRANPERAFLLKSTEQATIEGVGALRLSVAIPLAYLLLFFRTIIALAN
jgi:hypothetical protein